MPLGLPAFEASKGTEKKEVVKKSPKNAPKKAPEKSVERQKLVEEVREREQVKIRMARLKESQEKKENILVTVEHSLGEYVFSEEDRQAVPTLRKDYEYRSIGGVDATSFDHKLVRDAAWLQERSILAGRFAALWSNGQIETNFSTLKTTHTNEMLAIIDHFARVDEQVRAGTFDAKAFKANLDAKYSYELLYGPQGAYNLLLAIHRADEAVKGKDPGEVLYDLRIGKTRLSEASRVTQLREMKKMEKSSEKIRVSKSAPVQVPVEVPLPADATPTQKESFDEREHRQAAEKVLNEGSGLLKDEYVWREDLDAMAEEIAWEVIKAVNPDTSNPQRFMMYLKGTIRARFTVAKKENPESATYTLDKKTKIAFIDMVLDMMEMVKIKRRAR